MKNVSVVIPTFKGLELLKKHLSAVLKAMRNGDQVIIIDDASQDKTVSWLKSKFHLNSSNQLDREFDLYLGSHKIGSKRIEVLLISNHQNLRFGATVNRGVDHATHNLIFVINNDVTPTPSCISQLTTHFSDNSIFAVGCLEIENPNETDPSRYQLGGKNRLRFEKGLFVHSRAKDFESGKTAWASGGSALFDKQKWQALGGFDKLFYPAYWEDIDLSMRAKRKGWKVVFDPRAVVHHQHQSTHSDVFKSSEINRMSWINGIKFTWRHSSPIQKIMFLCWQPYWIYKTSLKKTKKIHDQI